MSERPIIDWDQLPQAPDSLRQLYEAGYGTWTVNQPTGDPPGPTTGFHFLSLEEMKAMGPEERARLGVERIYQFALEHTTPKGASGE